MYDSPAIRWANDRLWDRWAAAIRARGLSAPEKLTHGSSPESTWRDRRLFVTQACGLPYVLKLHAELRLVATPCYSAPGCSGSRYRSILAVRRDDARRELGEFRNSVAAINGWHSHSGHSALSMALDKIRAPRPFFGLAKVSGSHLGSMGLVAEGRADICSIDCVTWAIATASGGSAATTLGMLGMTPSASGLPLVTPRHYPAANDGIVRESFLEALADPELEDACSALRLIGSEALDDTDYAPVLRAWKRLRQAPIAAGAEDLRGETKEESA